MGYCVGYQIGSPPPSDFYLLVGLQDRSYCIVERERITVLPLPPLTFIQFITAGVG